jgi:putative transposase
MEQHPIYWPQFYNATILEWKPLLKPAKYKDVIIQSLQYLTTNKKIALYSFVIMDKHIHLIWQAAGDKTPVQLQHSFMKYTAQQIEFDLVQNHPLVLDKFRVNAKDRTYQFWERNSLGIELYLHDVFMQKIEYIHWNPVKAGYVVCRKTIIIRRPVFIIQGLMNSICLHIAECMSLHQFGCWSKRPTTAFEEWQKF